MFHTALVLSAPLPRRGALVPPVMIKVFDDDGVLSGGSDGAGRSRAPPRCVATLRVNAKDADFENAPASTPRWFALRPVHGAVLGGCGGGRFSRGEILLSFELADEPPPESEDAAPPKTEGAATAVATAVDGLLADIKRQHAVVVVSVLGARDLRPPVGAGGRNARFADKLPQWPRLEARVQRGGRAPCVVGTTKAARTPAPSDPAAIH